MSQPFPQRESVYWLTGEKPYPPSYPTSLIERIEAAGMTPISELSPGQLRLLISQKIGVQILMPLAIELLQQQPLLEADCYPGDLLAACLMQSEEFWQQHPKLWYEVSGTLEGLDSAVATINEHRSTFLAGNPYGAQL